MSFLTVLAAPGAAPLGLESLLGDLNPFLNSKTATIFAYNSRGERPSVMR